MPIRLDTTARPKAQRSLSARRLGVRLAIVALVAGVLSSVPAAVASPSAVDLFVLTEPVRIPQYQAYQKAHPEVNLRIEPVAASDLIPKIQLAIASGAQVPDVVFAGDATGNAKLKHVYAANISKAVP